MRAFVKYGPGPGEAELREVDRPVPGRGEVLVSVAACGICGSDLHAYRSDPGYELIRTPVVMGHEFAGVVEETGPGTSRRAGERVVAVSIRSCGACAACSRGDGQLCSDRRIAGVQADGGLAGWAVVPERDVMTIPDRVGSVEAALAEPLSVAVHAVLDRSPVGVGSRVVVSGPGAIGLLCARVAALGGADVVVVGIEADRARRLPAAEAMGLRTARAGDEAPFFAGADPDVWIEASGSGQAFLAGLDALRPGGTMVVVGVYAEPVTFSPTQGVRRELTVRFSYASTSRHYEIALEMLADGRVDPEPLTDRFPLVEVDRVLRLASGAEAVKPVVVPTEEDR